MRGFRLRSGRDGEARVALPPHDTLRYASDEFDAARDAHALLVVTEWPQFAALDLDRLRQLMRYPVVIDGRNLFSLKKMAEAGFHYYSMGRRYPSPRSSPSPNARNPNKCCRGCDAIVQAPAASRRGRHQHPPTRKQLQIRAVPVLVCPARPTLAAQKQRVEGWAPAPRAK